MTTLLPFRFEAVGTDCLVTGEAGGFFFTTDAMVERMVNGGLTSHDYGFLLERGFAFNEESDFYHSSFLRRLYRRKRVPKCLSYLIVVPTLRCDLSCSYCQVSRADVEAEGYDWSDRTVQQFLDFVDRLRVDEIKIEFQGGEPTLRLDILQTVVEFCVARFRRVEFVVCTNLSHSSPEFLQLLERPEVSVSTSLDGPVDIHGRNRTNDSAAAGRVLEAVDTLRRRFGDGKVAALPTIAASDYGRIPQIIDAYLEQGLDHIFLRPISYHGFARKRHADSRDGHERWRDAYRGAIDYIFELNALGGGPVIETGLETRLRRIFWSSYTGHVDLRSPNPVGTDYLVVDFDGTLYPSDEARMLARIGQVDLSIGNLEQGLDDARIAELNWNQFNEVDPDCIHCAYQPYCGVDLIDDLAREGRTDMPRHQTWFCRSSMAEFGDIFTWLRQGRPRDLVNLSGHLTGHFDRTPFAEVSFYDPADPTPC